MIIRNATEADIPEIVSLLKSSLGETLIPKSQEYWRWKHLENPFGPSEVLLSYDGSRLTGVRAFMRWEWIKGDRTYKAVRAVDTATHPEYQGRGIFKKLTLAVVDMCTKQGDDFVFNTPNQHSQPGYLKMGWEKWGKLPIYFEVRRPLGILWNVISKRSVAPLTLSMNDLNYYLAHPSLDTLVQSHLKQMNTIGTKVSVAYLKWRYQKVPVASYFAVGSEKDHRLTGLVIGRIKTGRFGRELRITDMLVDEPALGTDLLRTLEINKKKWNIDFTSLSAASKKSSTLILSGHRLSGRLGPMITLRSLKMLDLTPLNGIYNWSPSIGDLELF